MTNEQRYKEALHNIANAVSSGTETRRAARQALQIPKQPSLEVLITALKENKKAIVICSDGSAGLLEPFSLDIIETFNDCAAVLEHLSDKN